MKTAHALLLSLFLCVACGAPPAAVTPPPAVSSTATAPTTTLAPSTTVAPPVTVTPSATVVPPPVTVTPTITAQPPTITPGPPAGRTYPWHPDTVTTTFWVGELFDKTLADGSQVCSTYDAQWAYHWGGVNAGKVPAKDPGCAGSIIGGCDGIPGPNGACATEARTAPDFWPTKVTPRENPFYLDLPFDDLNDATGFRTRCQVIPWANDPGYAGRCGDTGFSYMKNRWVHLKGASGRDCYGQIEDAGPSHDDMYHDTAYVFGTARPAQGNFNGAGADVSPALNGCLGFKDLDGENDRISWRFVDAVDVPPGPWKRVVTTSGVTVDPDPCAAPVVCTKADSGAPLTITKPGIYDGQGHKVPSIMVRSAGVTVRHFVVNGGVQAGIWSEGAGNVIADNDISNIAYGSDDVDAMRFFGDGTQVLRNRVHDLIRGDMKDAHPDCMQTYATPSRGASANVLIEGNDCRGFDWHQCLMAEGPGSTDGGGGGKGRSENWVIRDNTCEGTSNQAIGLRGIQNVRIEGNRFLGRDNKAIQSTDGSTVTPDPPVGNVLGPNVKTLIGG